jgi:hypothetical protein
VLDDAVENEAGRLDALWTVLLDTLEHLYEVVLGFREGWSKLLRNCGPGTDIRYEPPPAKADKILSLNNLYLLRCAEV